MFFNELDFDHEDHEVQANKYFEEPFVTLQYIPPSLPSIQGHVTPSVNPPHLGFGVGDIMDEFESCYMSGFQCFQPCLDQEDIVPQVNDTTIDDETIDITDS